MANAPKKSEEKIVEVMEIQKGIIEFNILGTTPLILNTMSEKARRTILEPGPKKNRAEKASTAKHNPPEEFRASAYTFSDKSQPTFIGFMASAFKAALKSAAVDIPGATKAEIGRLTYVEGDYVGIYGVPKLFMAVTRSADMARTPDIRTRAILPEWACVVRISYVKPLVTQQSVVNLLAAAGLIRGIGDWRPEKGSGSYGQFSLVGADDPDFKRIIKTQGRAAQIKGFDNIETYDDETEKLYSWHLDEMKRREIEPIKKAAGKEVAA